MLRLFSSLCAVVLIGTTLPATAATPADLAREVSQQIARCWNPPAKASGSVTIRVEFNQDGTVVGTPKVVGLASDGVAKSAIHAVQLCQPYRLPVSMFSIWQHTSIKLSLEK